MILGGFMKQFALFCLLFVPMTTSAQKQFFLPTGDSSMDEKERPLIEVYLPKQDVANGCAVVLCPGGAMRWLSWESDVIKMATFLNQHGIAAIGLRYHLNKGDGQMPQGVKMPPMVDVTHPDQFPQADANPMHFAYGDSIINLAALDAKAAIRMVREHADEWHISKDKIGYLGFSAGGGVAIAATMSAEAIEHPDFLCTNFGPSLMPVTVPKDAPPLLIMTRVDHPNVAAGLVALFMEWKKAGANAELHMYGDGKGPYELMSETGNTTTETWSTQMIQWLKAKGFIGSRLGLLPVDETTIDDQDVKPTSCGPVPTENQLQWQDMEMYAFIHYSLNTYTDQEWGFGNEALELFNPSNLDCKQWARVCKQAGMKGIIFTAKHHCGFCMWPSEYTEYSVKNTPWKNGKGDVVRELAEACREEGLKFAVYLSPWDRNHKDYGKPEYVTYFRNQLRELLTEYGDIFEVWFDGANGGDGWYGGANETRKIDRTTYYEWPETYKMIRALQPNAVIWNDGGDRGDLRWVGTEAGNVGETNWSLLNSTGDVPYEQLHYGLENGDVWVPGETNTSIRPGWFYHKTEDEHVKSLSKLMDTYYKSVGRNSTLLLNFPIAPNGRIHPNDSLRGIAFYKMIHEVFKTDLTTKAKIQTQEQVTTIDFKHPTAFNRFVVEEDIRYGQRVKKFALEALIDGQWQSLKDELVENGDGLTTIGHRRIICFPTVQATQLRFTILEAKCEPIITRISVYLAPKLTADIPDAGEKKSSSLHFFYGSSKQVFIDWDREQTIKSFRYLPPQTTKEGTVTHYSLWASNDWQDWKKVASGEFSNIVNNPIWQTIKFNPIKAKVLRLDADCMAEGDRLAFDDMEVVTE